MYIDNADDVEYTNHTEYIDNTETGIPIFNIPTHTGFKYSNWNTVTEKNIISLNTFYTNNIFCILIGYFESLFGSNI